MPEGCRAYVLNRGEYWLRPVSDTFHGRDIFAPSAAHFSLGVPPEKLGYPIATLVGLNVPEPIQDGNAIRGRVVYVDRFGNLVSNIRPRDVAGDIAGVEIEGERISGLSRSYAEAEGLLAIIGSHGYLEVAVTEGSAARHLNAEVGTRLTVVVG